MRAALVQFNPTIGDLDANIARMGELVARARESGAELVVFPELSVCGYPPRDLLLHEGFVRDCARAADDLGRVHGDGLTLVLGAPLPLDDARPERGTTNSLLAFRDGRAIARYDKRLLPTYDVFDEDRYFVPGERATVIDVPTRAGGEGVARVGLSICEDLWKGEDAGFASRYLDRPDPVLGLVRAGARVVVNPPASPFVLGKGGRHRAILARHATAHGVIVAGVNQVGGNDDLVFDGHAAAYDGSGRPIAFGPGFEEAVVMMTLAEGGATKAQAPPPDPLLAAPPEELLFRALVLGTRDYLRKTGHARALVGLSGGIDSAVTCALASRAVGAENVLGVSMPGKYSSPHSITDAEELARRLGVRCLRLPISGPFEGFRATLDAAFEALGVRALGATLPDLAEENLQSRTRGVALMTISNRTGAIVLTTGNKSELAVGYCTLYGDTNGGLAVLGDLTKAQVYALARWMNAEPARAGFAGPPIPESSITKPPSAELAPGQTDQDTLPPYEVLDEVVARYVERKQSVGRIARECGLDAAMVARLARMIDLAEYKRQQLAVGIKVTGVAFGSGRRVPIAQRWRSDAPRRG